MPDDDLALVLGHHEAPAASRSDRRRFEHDRRRRRRRRGRALLVLLVAVVVVGGATLAAATVLKPIVRSLTASGDYAGEGTGSVRVTIAKGSSGKSIGRVLERAGVVKTAGAFADAAAAEPRAQSIQPGQYVLRQKMSAAAALALLLDPSSRSQDKVTVREGLRATEVAAVLSAATGRPLAQYQAALKNPASIGLPAVARGNAEGWLFPATYTFEPGQSAADQLAAMVTQTRSVLAALKVPDSRAEQLLVVASIAEVEAASPADYAKVARVLDNRLADKLHNGRRLQLDSTVSYALGTRRLTTTSAQRATASPYNTYVHPGLPAGPISNPGRAAIVGALRPTPGPWLFFVTVDPSTGDTRFAVTAAQHAANVALFQSWCRSHAGQC